MPASRQPALAGGGALTSRLPAIAGRYGTGLAALGGLLHLGHTVTLGVAAGRPPWGTMGEFVAALTLAAVGCFLVLAVRHRAHYLGPFVMIAAVAGVALATTVLHRPLPQLVPALHSYWLSIHVTAALAAAGANTVGTALVPLCPYRSRRDSSGSLSDAETLDRLAQRTVVFAFPLWTLAIVTGAIWAEGAWGRYWGWDPKETWAFIAWLAYAAYLHARSTTGWRARRAAVICCVAYACVLFNLVVVNVWITGLHSYALP